MTTTTEHSSKTSGTSCSTRTIVVSATWCRRWSKGMNASASRWAIPAVGSSSEQDPGLRQHDGGQVDHPAGTGRQLRRAVVTEPLQAEGGDHLVDGLHLAPLGPPCPRQAQCGGEHPDLVAGVLAEQEHVEDGQLGIEPAVLERPHHADRRVAPRAGTRPGRCRRGERCPTAARRGPRSRRASSSSPSRWPRSAPRWRPARPRRTPR